MFWSLHLSCRHRTTQAQYSASFGDTYSFSCRNIAASWRANLGITYISVFFTIIVIAFVSIDMYRMIHAIFGHKDTRWFFLWHLCRYRYKMTTWVHNHMIADASSQVLCVTLFAHQMFPSMNSRCHPPCGMLLQLFETKAQSHSTEVRRSQQSWFNRAIKSKMAIKVLTTNQLSNWHAETMMAVFEPNL